MENVDANSVTCLLHANFSPYLPLDVDDTNSDGTRVFVSVRGGYFCFVPDCACLGLVEGMGSDLRILVYRETTDKFLLCCLSRAFGPTQKFQ